MKHEGFDYFLLLPEAKCAFQMVCGALLAGKGTLDYNMRTAGTRSPASSAVVLLLYSKSASSCTRCKEHR